MNESTMDALADYCRLKIKILRDTAKEIVTIMDHASRAASLLLACLLATTLFTPPTALGATLDTGFGSGGIVTTSFGGQAAAIRDIAVQPDGKILAAGYADFSGVFSAVVVRYTPNGNLDPTFGTGGVSVLSGGPSHQFADSVVIQSDGHVIVAGRSCNSSDMDECSGVKATFSLPGAYHFSLWRLNSDGSLDYHRLQMFSVGSSAPASALVQADGKVLVGGYTRAPTWDGVSHIALARYSADLRAVDTSFGSGGVKTTSLVQLGGRLAAPGGGVRAQDMLVLPDGKIVVAAMATINISPDDPNIDQKRWLMLIARYDANGNVDSSFGIGGAADTSELPTAVYDYVPRALATDPEGRFVVVGDSMVGFAVARFSAGGVLDTTFGNGGGTTTFVGGPPTSMISGGWWSAIGFGLHVNADGSVLVGGYGERLSNIGFAIGSYSTDGVPSVPAVVPMYYVGEGAPWVEDSFGGLKSPFGDMLVQDDGSVLLGGYTHEGDSRAFALARFSDVAPTSWSATCSTTPLTGCLSSGSGKLGVKRNLEDPAKSSIKWAWSKGQDLPWFALGDPTTYAGYALCVYDAGVLRVSAEVPASGLLWEQKLKNALEGKYVFKDKLGSGDGITSIKLAASTTLGKSKISLGGKGIALANPAGPTQLFSNANDIVVQFTDAAGLCFETVFTGEMVSKNRGNVLAAKY